MTVRRADGFASRRRRVLRFAADSHDIVTGADLASMKPSSVRVNTRRAKLIEAGALLEALRAGRPGRAAVDVCGLELSPARPLLQLNNAICTQHLGQVDQDCCAPYFGAALDHVHSCAAGRPVNIVNQVASQ